LPDVVVVVVVVVVVAILRNVFVFALWQHCADKRRWGKNTDNRCTVRDLSLYRPVGFLPTFIVKHWKHTHTHGIKNMLWCE
jgi:hypothetical protein